MSERKSLLLVFVGCVISSIFITGMYTDNKKSNIEYKHKMDSLQSVKDSIFRVNRPNYNDLYE